MASGLVLCLLTDYYTVRTGISMIDELLKMQVVAISCAVIAISGMANAVNMIDGFHGLASGAAIIMLLSLAIMASTKGDYHLALAVVVVISLLVGFLLTNFPIAHIMLGDGGAYFVGVLVGSLALALVSRNPEFSLVHVAMVMWYPIWEVLFSIIRKTAKRGTHPAHPDKLHLHLLVYHHIAMRIWSGVIEEQSRRSGFANPTTSVLLLTMPAIGLLAVLLAPRTWEWSALAILLQTGVYSLMYWFSYCRSNQAVLQHGNDADG